MPTPTPIPYTPDAKFYSSISTTYEYAFSHDAGLHSFLSLTLSHLPPSSKILDAGCGTGKPVASTLSAAGHSVLGIDISPSMVDRSREAAPDAQFQVADMRTFAPEGDGEGNFDAVFNILSLFILSREEMENMAKKWASWIKKDGLLFICTIAAEDLEHPDGDERQGVTDPDGLCVRDIGVQFMGRTVHVTLFTREGWRVLLEGNGFEIVEASTQTFVPPEEAQSDEEPHYFIIARKT
ncbi:S-adenosyl-L-methionine-dependent methyltransferase [Clohesyomyces aquaticus]|uniref:S-adenosyl-L-methionine-dependent methyltransferase n=1 Tax=Clohesyomyces aquaticus TaxID=1231657 RepID=A0A1Y1ZIS7_9PLEO|nr:S-adenosyl-L-methionine-dependent methyltransferase [Clohesyomyces aquaticus]